MKRKRGKTAKEKILEILEKLPDDCTFEDVQREVYFLAKENDRDGAEPAKSDEATSAKRLEELIRPAEKHVMQGRTRPAKMFLSEFKREKKNPR